MPIIKNVIKNSFADKSGIKSGDELISINGNLIKDILDLRYFSAEHDLRILLKNRQLTVKKDEYEDLGIEFDTYLIDKNKSCCNKCMFCFIDQLPKNMRKTLYYKDDDYRLSFLQGNYITLTNLNENDISKIIRQHISPINISVHTLNKEKRIMILGNKNAGNINSILKRFAKAKITMNCQIVVMPDINDGSDLKNTIKKLYSYYPYVNSVSIVPVGLTRHRDGLADIKPIDRKKACDIIDIVQKYNNSSNKKNSYGFCYAADELYLKAGMNIPNTDYYDDFPQLENGVGLTALFEEDFYAVLNEINADDKIRKMSVVTGCAAFKSIEKLINAAKEKLSGLSCNIYPIENKFFGESVDVTGLITGTDIISQLKSKELGDVLLLPDVLLRFDNDLLLDDISIEDIEKELNIKVKIVKTNGRELARAFT